MEFCSVNLENSEEGTIFLLLLFSFSTIYYLGTKNCYQETGAPVWQQQRFTNEHGVSRPLRVLSGIVSRYLLLNHKLDKTEGASDQFSDMDFQFLAIWAAQGSRGKNPIMNYDQLLSSVFSMFSWAKKKIEI